MQPRKRVLIAETAKATRATLTFLLGNRGYEVLPAASGREALDIARGTSLDLVVLGAELPELSGYDVYRLLKSDPETLHLPILLLIAMTDTFEAPTRTLPNPEFLLCKPFSAHDFLQRVGRLLASENTEPARP